MMEPIPDNSIEYERVCVSLIFMEPDGEITIDIPLISNTFNQDTPKAMITLRD